MKKMITALFLVATAFSYAQDEYAFDEDIPPAESDEYDDEYVAYEENAYQCDNCGWINYYWDDYVEDSMERETAWPGKREDSFYDYIIH